MKDKITVSRIIEAVLFASDAPVEAKKLLEIIGDLSDTPELLEIINILNNQFEETGRPFRIVEVAGGFQFETLPQYGVYVEKLYSTRFRPKLSRASLETLAIVAYKQPISKSEIDALRGVDSDASVRTLQNRDLLEIKGIGDSAGKPRLYGTTLEFLRYFGLKEIMDLPGADELASMFDGSEIVKPVPEQLTLDTEIKKPPQESSDNSSAENDK